MRYAQVRCMNKRQYYSEEECLRAISKRVTNREIPLYAYKCPECERWHMTRFDPREYGMRRGER